MSFLSFPLSHDYGRKGVFGDYTKPLIRILINQPVFQWNVIQGFCCRCSPSETISAGFAVPMANAQGAEAATLLQGAVNVRQG